MPSPQPFIFSKIIATLGPATRDVDAMVNLIKQGADAFRINFSHGTFSDFAQLLQNARAAGELAGVNVGVMGDLCGPKIRVGEIENDRIMLRDGDGVVIRTEPTVASRNHPDAQRFDAAAVLSTTLPTLIDDAEVGQRVLIDDGAIRMLIVEKITDGDQTRLICSITHGGEVSRAKGINLPDTKLNIPTLTERDHACAQWAVNNGVDYIALSFVRSGRDVKQLRSLLSELSNSDQPIPIIAKIEKPQALKGLNAIVQAADGLMVARGDLGVEMDLAEVPAIQKRIISIAHDYGKPVIVATQMLQSMIDSRTPTRAEVSDVANAIYDGTDAIMLSGETAVGRFPVETITMMNRIAEQTETDLLRSQHTDSIDQLRRAPRKLRETRYRTAALAHGVSTIVRDLGAKLIVTWSQLGGGARYLSQNRMNVPIIAASSDQEALRRMSMLHAVQQVLMDRPNNVEEFTSTIEHIIVNNQWAAKGDCIVVIAGEPIGTPGVTNSIRIHYIGDHG